MYKYKPAFVIVVCYIPFWLPGSLLIGSWLRSCTTLALGAERISRQASTLNLGAVAKGLDKSPSKDSEFLDLYNVTDLF